MACATNTRRNEVKNDTLPHWALAREGIKLIINNNCAEAEQLFLEHPDSLAMYSGYSFAVMMDALMSYEEEKLNKAIQVLRDLEKRCASETGWLRQVTQRVFSFTQVDAKSEQSLADQLETQIILADSQVCIAILTFLQQELSAYLKGGWALRKAWKVYQKVYKDILNLYNEKIGELQLPDPSQNPSPSPTELQNSVEEDRAALSDWDIPDLKIGKNGYSQNHSSSPRFPHSKSANLEPSKNPPSASNTSSTSSGLRKSQSVCNALTNRQNFWSARMDSISRSTSMSFYNISSILSSQDYTLSLLWYHTIVRPFYAIDGTNVQAGVECSERLLKESEAEFSQSALFLFFTGRVCRLNISNLGLRMAYYDVVGCPNHTDELPKTTKQLSMVGCLWSEGRKQHVQFFINGEYRPQESSESSGHSVRHKRRSKIVPASCAELHTTRNKNPLHSRSRLVPLD
ncbi:unnamed protein product [Acanthoscelides obtectus]|uniref:Uncharacterized protein n=1 Tax=Acanthoscelides obtectus TaxID=200917 RepID=A0A9P0PHU6_ACAOB|nr:unnamed protein product [Acanthoscelides obtectus]CAK1637771.1 Tetratricopeptide repeat protein 39C [Acanthoscelides obtectus]